MNLKSIISIAKKEIRSNMDNPALYIALIVYLLVWEFLFFRNVFLVGEASLRTLFDYVPWTLMFFASAVTMGSFAEEKNSGTLELLLTHPVTALDVIIGKFLSSTVYVLAALIFAIPLGLSLSAFGALDWGMVAGQILGSLFFAMSVLSLGLFLSILLSNQVAALLATIAGSFFFIIAGTELVTANLPLQVIPVFERLSLLSHMESMSRGVIDLRDIWYFLSFVAIFLAFTYIQLLKLKYGNRRDYYRTLQMGIGLFIGIAVLTNIVGSRIPGRLDLTQSKVYSLSGGTKQTVGALKDIVTVTLYASSKLPSQLVPTVRDTKDILRDYVSMGKGNIVLVTKDPSNNPDVAQEAASQGIREIQFNVIGQEEFQVKTGFLGLLVSYAGKHEVIPFIQSSDDLEYQITGFISKLTNKNKKTIGFLSGFGSKELFSDLGGLKTELEKQFTVVSVPLDPSNPRIATNVAALVVPGPRTELDRDTVSTISAFISGGKSVLLALDPFDVSPQTMAAQPVTTGLDQLLSDYGVSLNADMVYDLRSNETVRVGQGPIGFVLPYPYWIRALPGEDSAITRSIEAVVMPWAGDLKTDDEVLKRNGYEKQILLETSQFAGVQKEAIEIAPDKASFSRDSLGTFPVAVAVTAKKQSGSGPAAKIVVIGDSDFLTDQFTGNSPHNVSFMLSALSWLTSDGDDASAVPVRKNVQRKLLFRSEADPALIKYANIAIAVIIPLTIGLVRYSRRRKLRTAMYQNTT